MSVVGSKKIVDNGSESQRWDLVILGDGYRADELKKYERDVDRFVAAFLAEPPFDQLRLAINIHRVDVVSNESGAGDRCAGLQRDTFLGSHFCAHNIPRLLVSDAAKAQLAAEDAVPEVNATLVMVNSTTYGGSGGNVAVFSLAESAFRIALHEMGHSHFKLADEYEFLHGCNDANTRYRDAEPAQPNVTTQLNPLKWAKLVTHGVPIPTTQTADCSDCDSQENPVSDASVGAYEGGRNFRCGIYRAQYDCIMRNLRAPFCVVCQDAIRRVLAPFLPKKRRAAR